DPVKPACQRLPLADRTSFTDEDEEAGLKGVLRVGLVAQHPAANLQHHWPMTVQQSLEGSLVLLVLEPLEQLMVRQFQRMLVPDGLPDELQDQARGSLPHHAAPSIGIDSFQR